MSKEAATAEEVKEIADTVQAEAAEKTPRKRGPKKSTEAKDTTKKKAGRPKKSETKAETAPMGTVTVLQYDGNEVDMSKVEENIRAQFVAEGHRAGNIRSLQIYVKPQEYKAYYVINEGKFDGAVDLF